MELLLQVAFLVLVAAILLALYRIENFVRLILFKLAQAEAIPAAQQRGARRRLAYWLLKLVQNFFYFFFSQSTHVYTQHAIFLSF